MRSALDKSYLGLSVEQALLFRRLSLHPTPEFGISAAAVLADNDSAAVERALEVLAELELVESLGHKRYRVQSLQLTYATHRAELDDTFDDRQKAARRVLSWYARTAQHADRVALPVLAGMPGLVASVGEELHFSDRQQAVAWLREEQTNLISAVRRAVWHGRHELVIALVTSLRFVSYQGLKPSEVFVELLSLGLAAARANGSRSVEALLYSYRSDTLLSIGGLDEAESGFAQALAIGQELDDQARQMEGFSGLGRVRLEQDRLPEARKYYQQALPLSRGLNGGRAEAVVYANLSEISTRLGEFEQALDYAEQELALRRQAGDVTGVAYALHGAALARQGMREHETAVELCLQAAASYRELDHFSGDFAQTVLTLATLQEQLGDRSGAATSLGEAITVLDKMDDPRVESARQRLALLGS